MSRFPHSIRAGAEKVENWKIKIGGLGIPEIEGPETLTTPIFDVFFIYFKYFIYSSFHFLRVWGRKSSFSPKSVIFHITLEH
jgi:hypothetical protein